MPATTAPQIPPDETRLEFPDNRLLPELTGAYGAHLTQVEQALAVQIVQRGNQLVILGEPGSRARAAEALNALYARAEAGRGVEPAEVAAELRMSGRGLSDPGTGGRDGDQMELLPRGALEIRTRKKTVEPRTEAQRAYVESLFSNEMAFGIGPAGTGQDLPRRGGGRVHVHRRARGPDRAVAPRGGGGGSGWASCRAT